MGLSSSDRPLVFAHRGSSGTAPENTIEAFAEGRARDGEGKRDRFEQERQDFFERVRNAYLERARSQPGRFAVIDATADRESVQQAILAEVEIRLLMRP